MDHALLVGINAYPPPNKLHGCLDDIEDITKELTTEFHFDRANIVSLTDAKATAAAIRSALGQVVAKVKSGDRFIFWYSGHGDQLIQGNIGTDVICPVNYAFTKETAVTVDDFHEAFKALPAGCEAIWGSDSCHSGDLERDFHSMGVPRQFIHPPEHNFTAALKTVTKTVSFRSAMQSLPNIVLLAGCRSAQTSADAYIDGRYNGAFSYYFLKGLQATGGLQKTLTELMEVASAGLKRGRYSQTPQISGPQALTKHRFLQS